MSCVAFLPGQDPARFSLAPVLRAFRWDMFLVRMQVSEKIWFVRRVVRHPVLSTSTMTGVSAFATVSLFRLRTYKQLDLLSKGHCDI